MTTTEPPLPPPQLPPAGWYPDPSGQGGARWWDGVAWAPLAQPSAPMPPQSPASTRRRGRARWWVSGVIVVAALIVVGAALVPGSSSPAWPKSIAPIAAFDSKDRGLNFEHTVPVHFVAPKLFDKQIAEQDHLDNAAERAQNRRSAAELRSLGLIGGSVNLNQAQTTLDSGSVLAYYDDQAKDIVVRGTHLDPATKVTLAHELTHTLQDQHFNLSRLDNRADTADSSFAETALVEGDAVLTQNDYEASLPASQQRQADAEMNAGGGSSSTPGVKPGPTTDSSFLDVASAVPYVLGPDFVLVLYDTGGLGATNQAFRHPPQTQLDILDPSDYLLGTPVRTLAPPHLGPGQRRDGPSDAFGAFDTYMTLAGYMDARAALAAADGWGGGSYVQYTQKGTTCTKVDIRGRTPATGLALVAAFNSWAQALPLHQATVGSANGNLVITACDPGRLGTAGPRSRAHALDIAQIRNENLGDAFTYRVTSPQVAQCVGDQALADPTLLAAQSTEDSSSSAPAQSVQSTIDNQTTHLIALCRGSSPPASP